MMVLQRFKRHSRSCSKIFPILHNPKVTSAWLEMFHATTPDEAEPPDAEVLRTWSADVTRLMENLPGLIDGLLDP